MILNNINEKPTDKLDVKKGYLFSIFILFLHAARAFFQVL